MPIDPQPPLANLPLRDQSISSSLILYREALFNHYKKLIENSITLTRDISEILVKIKFHYFASGISGVYTFIISFYAPIVLSETFSCKKNTPIEPDEFFWIFWSVMLAGVLIAFPMAIQQFYKISSAFFEYARGQDAIPSALQKTPTWLNRWTSVAFLFSLMTTGLMLQQSFSKMVVDPKLEPLACLQETWENNHSFKTWLERFFSAITGPLMAGPQLLLYADSIKLFCNSALTTFLYILFITVSTLAPILQKIVKQGDDAYSKQTLAILFLSTLFVALNRFVFYYGLNQINGKNKDEIEAFMLAKREQSTYKKSIGIFSALTGSVLLGYIIFHSLLSISNYFGLAEDWIMGLCAFIASNEAMAQGTRYLGAWLGASSKKISFEFTERSLLLN